jgi:hypothetical protein
MLVKAVLYLVNLIMRGLDRAALWVVDVMDSLYRLYRNTVVRRFFYALLDTMERLIAAGRGYLDQVRQTLRYRLYFDSVTGPMKAYYRRLRRR